MTAGGPPSRWPAPAEGLSACREQAPEVAPAARRLREPRRWWAWATWGLPALAWLVAVVAVLGGPDSLTVWDDGRLEQMGRLEALLLLAIVGGVLLPMPWTSRLLTHARTMPWVNLPHKEFWARTPRRLARAERLTWEVLAVLTLWAGTLAAVPLIGPAWASQGGALPPEWVVPAALGADIVLLPVLLVWIMRVLDPERAAADLPAEEPLGAVLPPGPDDAPGR